MSVDPENTPASSPPAEARPGKAPPETARAETEGALVRAIRAGDRSAWGRLYELTAPDLYRRILMPRLGNPTLAEDALAETFRTAIERLDAFEDRGRGIFAWLARIAHNKAMDLHRAGKRRGETDEDLTEFLGPHLEPMPGADDLLELRSEAGTLGVEVAETLDHLNPRYARAIRLRYFEERDRESCAKELEVKVATFDVLLLRALRAFGQAFRKKATP